MNILILCTGNSARSIMAEAILDQLGDGRIMAFSAGSQPAGQVNPFAIKHLTNKGYETAGFQSKSWDVFAESGAEEMDVVITVCDSAGAETCPIWPSSADGLPIRVHWSFPDPAAVEGSDEEKLQAFSDVYEAIAAHMRALVSLPLERMTIAEQKENLNAIYEKISG